MDNEILKLLKAGFESQVARVDVFLSRENVPSNYVELSGGSVIGELYPNLKQVLLQFPDKYKYAMFYDAETDLIHLEDWTGYYLKHDNAKIGTEGVDTIRNITASVDSYMGGFANGSGAFRASDNGGRSHNDSGYSGDHKMTFDASLGIVGRSQHIGNVTEPQHKNVVFAVLASPMVKLDDFIK